MPVLLRLAALAGPVAVVAAATSRWALGLPAVQEATFAMLLTELAAWTVTGCCLWALVLLIAAATESLTRGRVAATRVVPCPDRLRRVVLAAVGAAVVCAVASPAQAEEGGSAHRTSHRASYGASGGSAGRLPVPARPDGVLRAAVPDATDKHRRVVVREGESLWRLAAARLPGAEDSAVQAAVAATYRANRHLIGPDPDLIQPGQRLVLPVPLQSDP